MKTRNFVLLASMLMVGTGAFAQRDRENNDRSENDKQKTEVRSERKSTDSRRSEVNKENKRRPESGEIVYSDRKGVRYSDRNERAHDRNDRAYEKRENRDFDRRENIHANIRLGRHQDACPLCYEPRHKGGFVVHYSIQDQATFETNRLAMVLDLNDRQTEKIYRINLRYLSRRSGNSYYAMERREREIRKVLRWGQVQAYEMYLRDMNDTDFCEHCHDGWGKGRLRIAFNINL